MHPHSQLTRVVGGEVQRSHSAVTVEDTLRPLQRRHMTAAQTRTLTKLSLNLVYATEDEVTVGSILLRGVMSGRVNKGQNKVILWGF